jgi:AcrR family transcriptional regulator
MQVTTCPRVFVQVSTCMQSPVSRLVRKRPVSSSADQTRQRLLDAAAETFSREGIQGATTRQIARGAGVNEVTLFRHFKSKEQLLRAVLQRGLAAEAAIMDEHSSWKENLRESMEKYARHYYSHLEKKKGIARAFLAEGHVLPKSMQTMIADVIRPVRERLVSILGDAQKAGVVRRDLNVECALDAFKNSLYAGMLRQGTYLPRNYSTDDYILTVVDIFLRGIEAAK